MVGREPSVIGCNRRLTEVGEHDRVFRYNIILILYERGFTIEVWRACKRGEKITFCVESIVCGNAVGPTVLNL